MSEDRADYKGTKERQTIQVSIQTITSKSAVSGSNKIAEDRNFPETA